MNNEAPKLTPHDSERLERYALLLWPTLVRGNFAGTPGDVAKEAVANATALMGELDAAGAVFPSPVSEVEEFVRGSAR